MVDKIVAQKMAAKTKQNMNQWLAFYSVIFFLNAPLTGDMADETICRLEFGDFSEWKLQLLYLYSHKQLHEIYKHTYIKNVLANWRNE